MIALLASHDIAYKTVDGALMAFESATMLTDAGYVDCSKWVDVSTWTRSELMAWLGY